MQPCQEVSDEEEWDAQQVIVPWHIWTWSFFGFEVGLVHIVSILILVRFCCLGLSLCLGSRPRLWQPGGPQSEWLGGGSKCVAAAKEVLHKAWKTSRVKTPAPVTCSG